MIRFLSDSAMNNCDKLTINQACLQIISDFEEVLYLTTQSQDCDKCDLIPRLSVRASKSKNLVVNTSYPTRLQVKNDYHLSLYNSTYHFGEGGYYNLEFNNSGDSSFSIEKEPVNIYLPLLYFFIFFVALKVFWDLGHYLQKKGYLNFAAPVAHLFFDSSDSYWSRLENMSSLYGPFGRIEFRDSSIENRSNVALPKRRLKSLDTFRGISIVLMIFVNYKGGDYYFFHHATWNGLTVADLIFPWFVWIMGVSIAISMRSILRRATPRHKIFQKILKRSLKLIALGIMLNTLNGHNDMSMLRLPGVLQRFAICYFVVASLHLTRAIDMEDTESRWGKWVGDLLPYWPEWIVGFLFLAAHLLITFFVADEGCPSGYLGPGGLHNHGDSFNCTGGAAGYIDRLVFSSNHIYQHPTAKKIYHSPQPYDPEGILGTFTSIFLTFLGLQAGKIILAYNSTADRMARWGIWALVTGSIALILTKASLNDGWIPINKNLWSVSFILAVGSTSFMLLAVCYYAIDIKEWWGGEPFYIPGMNAIVLYVGHEIMDGVFPWAWKLSHSAPHWEHLLMSVWGTSLWVLIAVYLHHKKIFITV